MMEYFRICETLNPKEIGKYPQVSDAEFPIHVSDPLFTANILWKKESRYVAPKPIIRKTSKLTDLVSSSVMGTNCRLLLSNRLKCLLESKRSYSMQYFNTSVIYKGAEFEDYWLTNPFGFANDFIDFQHSVITVGGITSRSYIHVHSKKNFDELPLGKHDYLIIENPVIKSNDFHFFALDRVSGGIGYYVSQELKSEIERSKCSGVVFIKSNEKYP